jgi:hypothetical protein
MKAPGILISLNKVENQYFCHSHGAAIALSCDVTCALRAMTIIVVDYTIHLQHCDEC